MYIIVSVLLYLLFCVYVIVLLSQSCNQLVSLSSKLMLSLPLSLPLSPSLSLSLSLCAFLHTVKEND